MARKGKVNKEMRNRRYAALKGTKPDLVEPTRVLTADELTLQVNRGKAAGSKDKPARVSREREFARRDQANQW